MSYHNLSHKLWKIWLRVPFRQFQIASTSCKASWSCTTRQPTATLLFSDQILIYKISHIKPKPSLLHWCITKYTMFILLILTYRYICNSKWVKLIMGKAFLQSTSWCVKLQTGRSSENHQMGVFTSWRNILLLINRPISKHL